jgi:hypothetical protein
MIIPNISESYNTTIDLYELNSTNKLNGLLVSPPAWVHYDNNLYILPNTLETFNMNKDNYDYLNVFIKFFGIDSNV